jgi:competence protein ComEA
VATLRAMFGSHLLLPPLVVLPEWRRLLPLAVPPLAALALLGAVWLFTPVAAPPPQVGPAPPPVVAPEAGLLVDVAGAVARPGLYRVRRGERTYAAIAAAGGLATTADPTRLPNMAAVLKDGEQVRVPAVGAGGTGGRTSSRVSLNAAPAAQLASIPGFTPDLVQAAIDYRTQYGGFSSLRELVTVLGMSPAAFAQAKPHLTT